MLEGPNGPVSHLICGGVYDGSTGLIYKGGGYFDPNLGIWLALIPLMVVQGWRKRKERRQWVLLLCVGLFAVGSLAGCCPLQSHVPTPTLPPYRCFPRTSIVGSGSKPDRGLLQHAVMIRPIVSITPSSVSTHNHFSVDLDTTAKGVVLYDYAGNQLIIRCFSSHIINESAAGPASSVPLIYYDDSGFNMNPGDSGGGVFASGSLIGNTWSHRFEKVTLGGHVIRETPMGEAEAALLPASL